MIAVNVGIGTTSPTLGLHVANGLGALFGPSGSGASTYISPDDEKHYKWRLWIRHRHS